MFAQPQLGLEKSKHTQPGYLRVIIAMAQLSCPPPVGGAVRLEKVGSMNQSHVCHLS